MRERATLNGSYVKMQVALVSMAKLSRPRGHCRPAPASAYA